MFAIILVIGTLYFHIAYALMRNKQFCCSKMFPDSLNLLYLPTQKIFGGRGVSYDFQIQSIICFPIKPAKTGGGRGQDQEQTSDLVVLSAYYLLLSSCLNGSYAENR